MEFVPDPGSPTSASVSPRRIPSRSMPGHGDGSPEPHAQDPDRQKGVRHGGRPRAARSSFRARRSRRPSPRRLIARTRAKRHKPGKRDQPGVEETLKFLALREHHPPRRGGAAGRRGPGTTAPASINTAWAITDRRDDVGGPVMLGRNSRARMCRCPAPSALAALTNSASGAAASPVRATTANWSHKQKADDQDERTCSDPPTSGNHRERHGGRRAGLSRWWTTVGDGGVDPPGAALSRRRCPAVIPEREPKSPPPRSRRRGRCGVAGGEGRETASMSRRPQR